MKKISLLFILFSIISCTSSKLQRFDYLTSGEKIDTLKYFPEKAKDYIHNDYTLNAISECLKKMEQINLSLKYLNTETYRFTNFPYFDNPIVITVTRDSIVVTIDYDWEQEHFDLDSTKLNIEENRILKSAMACYGNSFALKEYSQSDFQNNPEILNKISKYKSINDSLFNKYPIIIDTSYIDSLIQKESNNTIQVHNKTIKRARVKEQDYKTFIKSLDNLGFWKKPNPYKGYLATSYWNWTLEANTRNGYYYVCSWETEINFKKLILEFLEKTDLRIDKIE
jgi:hypothetical protein